MNLVYPNPVPAQPSTPPIPSQSTTPPTTTPTPAQDTASPKAPSSKEASATNLAPPNTTELGTYTP